MENQKEMLSIEQMVNLFEVLKKFILPDKFLLTRPIAESVFVFEENNNWEILATNGHLAINIKLYNYYFHHDLCLVNFEKIKFVTSENEYVKRIKEVFGDKEPKAEDVLIDIQYLKLMANSIASIRKILKISKLDDPAVLLKTTGKDKAITYFIHFEEFDIHILLMPRFC